MRAREVVLVWTEEGHSPGMTDSEATMMMMKKRRRAIPRQQQQDIGPAGKGRQGYPLLCHDECIICIIIIFVYTEGRN